VADDLGISYELLRTIAGDLRANMLEAAPLVREKLENEIDGRPPILGAVIDALTHMAAVLDNGMRLTI
jgi:hypothetical protein